MGIGHNEQAVAAAEDRDIAAVVDWDTEPRGRIECAVEVDPAEVAAAAENKAGVGAGFEGVVEVELDEIRAVNQRAPRLGDAPVAQEIFDA